MNKRKRRYLKEVYKQNEYIPMVKVTKEDCCFGKQVKITGEEIIDLINNFYSTGYAILSTDTGQEILHEGFHRVEREETKGCFYRGRYRWGYPRYEINSWFRNYYREISQLNNDFYERYRDIKEWCLQDINKYIEQTGNRYKYWLVKISVAEWIQKLKRTYIEDYSTIFSCPGIVQKINELEEELMLLVKRAPYILRKNRKERKQRKKYKMTKINNPQSEMFFKSLKLTSELNKKD